MSINVSSLIRLNICSWSDVRFPNCLEFSDRSSYGRFYRESLDSVRSSRVHFQMGKCTTHTADTFFHGVYSIWSYSSFDMGSSGDSIEIESDSHLSDDSSITVSEYYEVYGLSKWEVFRIEMVGQIAVYKGDARGFCGMPRDSILHLSVLDPLTVRKLLFNCFQHDNLRIEKWDTMTRRLWQYGITLEKDLYVYI